LYRLLKSSPNGLPEPLVAALGLQIARALRRLKEAGIIHRDVKSENILLRKGMCKLGDFGFAIEETRVGEHRFNLGSPLYMSL
jgi:wee1-like protein kinase